MNFENMPLISIVVPVYNAELYLDKCVQSILTQTYENIQVILVDDGSKDSSGKICDKYKESDCRVEVFHIENSGVSVARNIGLSKVKGKYIGFVDADDWIDPHMYEKLYEIMISHGCDIASVDIVKTSDSAKKITIAEENISLYNKEEFARKFFKINSQGFNYYIWNKLYKRELFSEDHFPEGIAIGEDVVALFKTIIKSEKIVESDVKMYYYRQMAGVTSTFNRKYFDLIKVWDTVIEIAKRDGEEFVSYAQLNRERINFTILSEMAISGENERYKSERDELLKELKKFRKKLCSANISFSRKIMINWFCISYSSAAFILHKFMKKKQ